MAAAIASNVLVDDPESSSALSAAAVRWATSAVTAAAAATPVPTSPGLTATHRRRQALSPVLSQASDSALAAERARVLADTNDISNRSRRGSNVGFSPGQAKSISTSSHSSLSPGPHSLLHLHSTPEASTSGVVSPPHKHPQHRLEHSQIQGLHLSPNVLPPPSSSPSRPSAASATSAQSPHQNQQLHSAAPTLPLQHPHPIEFSHEDDGPLMDQDQFDLDLSSLQAEWAAQSAAVMAAERQRLQVQLDADRAAAAEEEAQIEQHRLQLHRQAEREQRRREEESRIAREAAEARASGSAALRLQAAVRGYFARRRANLPSLLEQARAEKQRLAQLQRAEEDRRVAAEKARLAAEADIRAALERQRLEAERLEVQRRYRAEGERLLAEQAVRAEEERRRQKRLAAELAFQQRLAAEAEEAARVQRERAAAEEQERRRALECRQLRDEDVLASACNRVWRRQDRERNECRLMQAEDRRSASCRAAWSVEADAAARHRLARQQSEARGMAAEAALSAAAERLYRLEAVFGGRAAASTASTTPMLAQTGVYGRLPPSPIQAWRKDGGSHKSDRGVFGRLTGHLTAAQSGQLFRQSAAAGATSGAGVATRLQAAWRGRRARRDPSNPWAQHQLRRQAEQLRYLHGQATRIQAIWRGYRLRAAVASALEAARWSGDDDDLARMLQGSDANDIAAFLNTMPSHLLEPVRAGPGGGGQARAMPPPSLQQQQYQQQLYFQLNQQQRLAPGYPPQPNGYGHHPAPHHQLNPYGSYSHHQQQQYGYPAPVMMHQQQQMQQYGGSGGGLPLPTMPPVGGPGVRPGQLAAAMEQQQRAMLAQQQQQYSQTVLSVAQQGVSVPQVQRLHQYQLPPSSPAGDRDPASAGTARTTGSSSGGAGTGNPLPSTASSSSSQRPDTRDTRITHGTADTGNSYMDPDAGSGAWELQSVASDRPSSSRQGLRQQAAGKPGGGQHAPQPSATLEAVESEWGISDPATAELILRRSNKMQHARSHGSRAQTIAAEKAARSAGATGVVQVGSGTFGAAAGSAAQQHAAMTATSSSFVDRVRGAVKHSNSSGGGSSKQHVNSAASAYSRLPSVQDNLPDHLRPGMVMGMGGAGGPTTHAVAWSEAASPSYSQDPLAGNNYNSSTPSKSAANSGSMARASPMTVVSPPGNSRRNTHAGQLEGQRAGAVPAAWLAPDRPPSTGIPSKQPPNLPTQQQHQQNGPLSASSSFSGPLSAVSVGSGGVGGAKSRNLRMLRAAMDGGLI